jgi:S1-C subfamily serine protease
MIKRLKPVLYPLVAMLFTGCAQNLFNPRTTERVVNDSLEASVLVDVGPGLGSGWLIDKKGDVVTAGHIITYAIKTDIPVTVITSDGNKHSARIVYFDHKKDENDTEAIDMAVLNVEDLENHTPLPWGNSDEVEIGSKLIEIGNSFGLGLTVTQGIVSAKDRAMAGLLQYDAATNPGNSGGPALNGEGKVIAMTIKIFSPTSQSAGIAFGIPSNKIVARLKAAGLALE